MLEQIFTLRDMQEVLPCRKGLLLLDRAFLINENKAVGLKTLTMNEAYFQGHFPAQPILPGVLQIESVAQLAELVLWKKMDPDRKNDFYVKELRKVKFRRPNNPGDRLIINLDVLECNGETARVSAVINNCTGAASQMELVLAVREKAQRCVIPEYNQFDKGENVSFDVTRIMKVIPHRYPFLLVDYAVKVDDSKVVCIKNTTGSEPFFREYTDGYYVMTSSIIPEIVAQSSCAEILSNANNIGKLAYFMGIDLAEFFEPVLPGDQLRMEVDIPNPSKRFGKGEGYMYVDDKLAAHVNLSFALVEP